MTSTTRNRRIRFAENNFAQLTSQSITFTSELTAFPFTNAISNFRSRIWKPSGQFLIDGTNDTIYINDGADKSATITNASYTTPALLATEIQTQLNAVSSNWTVTYDISGGTYKFTISNSGSVTLRLSQTTTAIWDTIGHTTSSDITSTSFIGDQQRNHTSEYATFDMGYNPTMTFFAMIGPLDEVFSISRGATVKLMASNLNLWTSPPLELTLTVTDKGILRFLDDQSDTGYRFWRISIEDKLGSQGPQGLSIGNIYIGDYRTMTNTNLQVGFEKTEIDPSNIEESESGVLHFDTKTPYMSIDGMAIGLMTRAEKDIMLELYEKLGNTTPFYISLDPILCITDELEELTKYVVFSGAPKFKHIINDTFSMSLAVRELV